MKSFFIELPDELAAKLDEILDHGDPRILIELLEKAILDYGRVRTPLSEPVSKEPHNPPQTQSLTETPAPVRPAVDLTQVGFDSSAFMAGLMHKIKNRTEQK